MRVVGIHEAKTHLAQLVDQASKGESFVIAKAGTPVVKVVTVDAPDLKDCRPIDFMAGEIRVPDDFDTLGGDEIAALFEPTR